MPDAAIQVSPQEPGHVLGGQIDIAGRVDIEMDLGHRVRMALGATRLVGKRHQLHHLRTRVDRVRGRDA